MAILEKEVLVSVGLRTDRYYIALGYDIPKSQNNKVARGTKITVKVEDLPESSTSVKLTKVCDNCGKQIKNQTYDNIMRKRKANSEGKDYCKKCAHKKGMEIRDKKIIELNKDKVLSSAYPEIAKLLEQPDLAVNILPSSNKRYNFICPMCNFLIKEKRISTVFYFGLSCPRCSDGISYPEKFTTSLLAQLKIEFEYQQHFDWSENRRYDFYINSHNTIIEVHGSQHYSGGANFSKLGGRTFREEQTNDEYKLRMAKENGVDGYIVLDCSSSELEHLKRSILKSELSKLFDLSVINWEECHGDACGSLIKKVCELWNKNNDTTTVSEITKLNTHTIVSYLKKGSQIGWCRYDPKLNGRNQRVKRLNKHVVCLSKDGVLLGSYSSLKEASKLLDLSPNNVSQACRGKYKTSGGYKWMYKEDYEKYIAQAI